MIVTPAEMRAIEDAAFTGGSTPEGLMDAVGAAIAGRVLEWCGPGPATAVFYAGKGNNAGDALVAAAKAFDLARDRGAKVRIMLRLAIDDLAGLGDLPRRKLAVLPIGGVQRCSAQQMSELPRTRDRLVVVDGLLGIGAKGALRGPIKSATAEINALRRERGATVFAIDVPTGLDAETGVADRDAVVADETLAVGVAKVGLLTDQAANHVGRLRIIPLRAFADASRDAPDAPPRGEVVAAAQIAALLPPRPHESNKGMFGRVGIIAGSVGATGAAVMCAHACARAGAGLITLLTHPDIYPIVAGAASPEVMVKPLPRLLDALEMNFDVLGLGPGLGREQGGEVCELVARWPKSMVVDADGLNAVAGAMDTLAHPAGPRLLTPHPGEMQRLLHGSTKLRHMVGDKNTTRADTARSFVAEYPVALLLKGARTLVAEQGRGLSYNTTGNAGMATGGMGDVLTGICCALAGQRLGLYDAACAGAWLHGRAADLARETGESEQSLLPLDLLASLGRAFSSVRRDAF